VYNGIGKPEQEDRAMRKAVCYIRVSTEEQSREGVSLSSQDERLRAYCRMAGLDLVEVIREEGVSASKKLSTRPGGQDLLKLISQEKIRHVVALKLDRLFRDAEDALHQTKEWDKAGIALHLVDMGGQTINTAAAMGRFFLNMMAGFAELERNLIAERTATALNYKKNHLQVYSPVPLGYTRKGNELVENQEELSTVAKIMDMRAQGMSYGKIADIFNKQGIASKTGSKWYASTVCYIVKNSLYKEDVA
jgi:DNA invertase Pin-like site-specific DNA recombinase